MLVDQEWMQQSVPAELCLQTITHTCAWPGTRGTIENFLSACTTVQVKDRKTKGLLSMAAFG